MGNELRAIQGKWRNKKMTVQMPAIGNYGKLKKWMGIKKPTLKDCEMIMENAGYSEMNDIDWGYVK